MFPKATTSKSTRSTPEMLAIVRAGTGPLCGEYRSFERVCIVHRSVVARSGLPFLDGPAPEYASGGIRVANASRHARALTGDGYIVANKCTSTTSDKTFSLAMHRRASLARHTSPQNVRTEKLEKPNVRARIQVPEICEVGFRN